MHQPLTFCARQNEHDALGVQEGSDPPIDILARVAARIGEPDRAIAALQKLLSIPYAGPLVTQDGPLTPALLRLNPMFDPRRNDPRFQKTRRRRTADANSAQAMSDKSSFFADLKRRNVYKVAIAYGVIAWLLIQIATQTFPFFAPWNSWR